MARLLDHVRDKMITLNDHTSKLFLVLKMIETNLILFTSKNGLDELFDEEKQSMVDGLHNSRNPEEYACTMHMMI